MSKTEEVWFVGTDLAEDYIEAPGSWFVLPQREHVRVTLNDGTVHVYYGGWQRDRDDAEGYRRQEEEGGHRYVLTGTGELQIVHWWVVQHFSTSRELTETVSRESIAITYSANAWRSATGPHGEAPADERVQHKVPGRPDSVAL